MRARPARTPGVRLVRKTPIDCFHDWLREQGIEPWKTSPLDSVLCDLAGCERIKEARCADPECDLDVCRRHLRADGKCVYCSTLFIVLRKDIPMPPEAG